MIMGPNRTVLALAMAMAFSGSSVRPQSKICCWARTLRFLGTKVQKKAPKKVPRARRQPSGMWQMIQLRHFIKVYIGKSSYCCSNFFSSSAIFFCKALTVLAISGRCFR